MNMVATKCYLFKNNIINVKKKSLNVKQINYLNKTLNYYI